MTAFLEAYPGGSGRGMFAPEPAGHIDAIVMAQGVGRVHAVPSPCHWAVFSFTHDVFVRYGDSSVVVAVPEASTSDGSGPELNPAARRIPDGVTHIALISPEDCAGSISFYL